MATNALPISDFFSLSLAGGPALRSLRATSASALYRTSAKTVTHWPEWKRQLQEAGTKYLPSDVWNMVYSRMTLEIQRQLLSTNLQNKRQILKNEYK